jgi:16S rRNA (guanine527-N7)-methyltransferase
MRLANIEVVDKRIEELSKKYHEAFDIVTARAFAEMKSVISAGLPYLKSDGLFVLSRGPNEIISNQDLEGSSVVLQKRMAFSLPHSDYQRVIWVLKKRS